MEYQKDYSLLRPFDLEAAKCGENICGQQTIVHYEFVTGPDKFGSCCFTHDGEYVCGTTEFMRMLPLAWVEGKPVYKGDVLYSILNGTSHEVKDIDERQVLFCDEHYRICPERLTWQKPKTKKKVFVNLYKDDNGLRNDVWGVWHESKEVADLDSDSSRLACVEIEIDE